MICVINILGMVGKTCPYRTDDALSTDCTDVGLFCNDVTNVCECDSSHGWYHDGITCIQGSN